MNTSQIKTILCKVIACISQIDTEITQTSMSVSTRRSIIVSRIIKRVMEAANGIGHPIMVMGQSIMVWATNRFIPLTQDDVQDLLYEAAIKAGVTEEQARTTAMIKDCVKQIKLYPRGIDDPIDDEKRYEKIILYFRNCAVIIDERGNREVGEINWRVQPTCAIDCDYNPECSCEKFNAFLEKALPDPVSSEALLEYMGLCLVPNGHLCDPNVQKAVVLSGPADTGKSVLAKVVEKFFGDAAIRRNLVNMTNPESFFVRDLEGKRVCLANDTDNTITNVDFFKSLVSGEGAEADVKFKDGFQLEHYARFIIIGNSNPKVKNVDNAYIKRLLPIPFLTVIPIEQQDPHLAQEIAKEELPGIANRILDALSRLLVRGRFEFSDEMTNELFHNGQTNSHVREFLDDAGYHPHKKFKTKQSDLFSEYKLFCDRKSYRDGVKSSKAFGREMYALGYQSYNGHDNVKTYLISKKCNKA